MSRFPKYEIAAVMVEGKVVHVTNPSKHTSMSEARTDLTFEISFFADFINVFLMIR
jgi:hypothetical protein